MLEVEVERLPEAGTAGPGRRPGARPESGPASRKPMPPLVAGVVIDLVDLATMGVTGLYLGMPLGLGIGYHLGRRMGLDRRRSLGLGLLCGIYCTVPGTSPIPLGTLVGAYRAFNC